MTESSNFLDSFHSRLEAAAHWVGKNLNFVLGLLVVLLVAGSLVAGLNYRKQRQEGAALADYSQIERDYSNWRLSQNPNPADKTPPPPKVNPEELLTRVIKFIEAKGETAASQMAVLMASDLAQSLNKESEVLAAIEKNMKVTGKSVLGGLTLLKKGDWLANADKCEEAIQVWRQVMNEKAWTYLHDFARLKSGLCFEQLARYTEAEAQYDQVLNAKDARQDRWIYKEAQKFKRSLKWSQKQGS